MDLGNAIHDLESLCLPLTVGIKMSRNETGDTWTVQVTERPPFRDVLHTTKEHTLHGAVDKMVQIMKIMNGEE